MFAKYRKRNSLTLSQSNTGLCNIPNNPSSCNIDKKKSRKTKTKPNKRRSKKHQHITNIKNNDKSITKKRSQSRPRLSQARLFKISDQEITAKKRKKTEFIVNRKQKRNSIDLKHMKPLTLNKSKKSLKHIKENTESKPSKKKKIFKNHIHKNRKHFKTSSLQTTTKSKHMKHTNTNSDIDHINDLIYKTNTTKLIKNRYARPRTRSTPKQFTLTNIKTKPSYKYRGRGKNIKNTSDRRYKHGYSESHNINLNFNNEIFKQSQKRSKSNKPSLTRNSSSHFNSDQNKNKKKKYKPKINRLDITKNISPLPSLAMLTNEYIEEQKTFLNILSTYSDIDSYSTSITDSDIEYINNINKPTIHILISPKINEAVFIGYKTINNELRGKGKCINENDKLIEIPKPLTPKFTFKHIEPKYQPHKIKWSTKTTFTDSEFEYESNDNKSIITVSDSDTQYFDNKTVKINKVLSDLIGENSDISDSCGDYKQNKKKKDNDVYFGIVEQEIENNNDTVNDGELLFDFNSFVHNLSHKRLNLNCDSD